MSALVPRYPDRPAVIPHQGGTVIVSIHDAAYLEQKAVWKRKLAAAHPDASQRTRVEVFPQRFQGETRTIIRHRRYRLTGKKFREVAASYRAWRTREIAWYAAHGLVPPNGGNG